MKRYTGERRKDGLAKVVVWDDISFGMKFARYARLEARPELLPAGTKALPFEWGAEGQRGGAVGLALAILADCLGDERACVHAERFAQAVVSRFPPARWKIDEDAIYAALGIDMPERGPAGRDLHVTTKARSDAPAPLRRDRQLSALAAWLADGRRGGPALRLS